MKYKEIRRKVSNLTRSVDIIIGIPEAEGTIGYETAFWNIRQGKRLMIKENLSTPLVLIAECGGENKSFVYADVERMNHNKDYYEQFIKKVSQESCSDIIGTYYGG